MSVLATLRSLLSWFLPPRDQSTPTRADQALIQHRVSGHIKITRANGNVEHVNIPPQHMEVYQMPDGTLSPSYPENATLKENRDAHRLD